MGQPTIPVKCPCGKEFKIWPYQLNGGRGRGKYCSTECTGKYRPKPPKKGRLEENCIVCGKPFITWECKKKRGNGKFCSKECFDARDGISRPVEFSINKNNCFIVTSHAVYSTGYVVIQKDYERKSLHRIVYEECFGEIPEGLVVRHKCDVRNCINPEHLELGTQSENVMDTVKRGRTLRGENHPMRKLDEETVRKIKFMLSQGVRNCDIVAALNINKSTICNIKRGTAWSHIS